jgi:uncharacterized repeat protein (TIGR01451 family)
MTAADGAENDQFGYSTALSGDGTTVLVGAYRAADHGKSEMGAAYLFAVEAVDLRLVKNAASEVPQGSNFVYSFLATNHDPNVDAAGVTLTDTLPPEVSYISDDGGCTWNGATVACALGPLAKDGGRTSVRVTVRARGAHGATITNTASVSADQPDINPADNTDSVTTTISNTPPVASDSVLLAYEGAAVVGRLSAADAGDDTLTFSIVSPAAKGTAVITDTVTGDYTYTAAAGQTGADAFTFKANDGVDDSNIATVSVLIQPASHAPVANSFAITTYRGTTVTGILPASDANGDALTFSIIDNGAKGTAVITDAVTGAFTYTPNPGETGTDTFTFKVNDGTLDSDIAEVTVTLQPADRVQVTRRRGGVGSFDLSFLLLGVSLLAVRRCRLRRERMHSGA